RTSSTTTRAPSWSFRRPENDARSRADPMALRRPLRGAGEYRARTLAAVARRGRAREHARRGMRNRSELAALRRRGAGVRARPLRSEEHTSELQSRFDLV